MRAPTGEASGDVAWRRHRRGWRSRSWIAVASACVALAASCSNAAEGGSNPPSAASQTAESARVQVGRHASANPGSVNTFWLHAPEGLVVVDTQRMLSDARRALAEAQETGQPVVAVLLTHAHPDHVGGVGVFHEAYPQAPIYASKATDSFMRDDPLNFYQLTREGPGGEDYPAELTYPDQILDPDAPLQVGGVRLETSEFGPGEHQSATVYYEPRSGALFAGDLVASRATPALLEGNSCGWLVDLERLLERFPDASTLYPGHGAPGGAEELIDQQRAYIERFRGLVRPAVLPDSPKGEKVTPDEEKAIVEEVHGLYPDYPSVASIPNMLELNVASVAGELRAEESAGDVPEPCRDS